MLMWQPCVVLPMLQRYWRDKSRTLLAKPRERLTAVGQHMECSGQSRARDHLTRVDGSCTAAEPLGGCGTRILHWSMLCCPTSSFGSHMHRSRILQATAG
jgi:hypothetical protein